MRDDLAHLQQNCQECSLACFQGFKAKDVRTQWGAEKLFVKEGEHFVEHKNDVLEYQSRSAQVFACGDFDAGTAEEPGLFKTAELQPLFLPTVLHDDELHA
ncbi:hypothetical protein ABBQ38_000839 [Trebouxia sp. C0009 RCD-2024]